MAIPFADKCGILGQFWIDFRNDEDLKTFVEYNDVGLPLAYFIAEGLVTGTPMSEEYVSETFDLFIQSMNVTEEEIEGIDNLTALLELAYDKKGEDQEDN
jgi:hypothetical protein